MSWIPISKCYVTVEYQGQKHVAGLLNEVDGKFRFAYGKNWLANPEAFPFDPINLPLQSEVFSSERLWGAFADSMPDNWGKRVMLAIHTQKPANAIEWLLATRGTGVGALTYSGSVNQSPQTVDIPTYQNLAGMLDLIERIEIGDFPKEVDANLIRLVEFGSSMGGARPKVTVSKNGRHYLAKLARKDDAYDQLRAEQGSLKLASMFGISVPDSHIETISGRPVLFIQRFDFDEAGGRKHYLSARSIINAHKIREGKYSEASYMRIASDINRISSDPKSDREDLFRRMVLNVLIRNTDDHLQNHGWLADNSNPTRYRLSPCFDILPHPASTDLMALNVGEDLRKATLKNVLSCCQQFGLSRDNALRIIGEGCDLMSQCKGVFEETGMKPLDVKIMVEACTRLLPEFQFL